MRLFLFISLSLLGLVILSLFFENTSFISDGILAITGIIVAWYTYETSQMKNEMVTQRRLSSSPFVIIEENNKKFVLSNYGTPAINIEISGVDLGEYDTFIFPKIPFLAPNSHIEIIGKHQQWQFPYRSKLTCLLEGIIWIRIRYKNKYKIR